MKNNIKLGFNLFIAHFTLAKLLGGLCTALVVATLKFYISGGFHIENSEWGSNVGIAFFAWTLNTSIIALLTDYLGIKGLNFNLKQFIYGFDTMKIGQGYPVEKFKPKLYNAMDSLDESNPSKGLDKGKGLDTEAHSSYSENKDITSLSGEESNKNKRSDNGKNKIKVLLEHIPPVESYRAAWFRAFPGIDPASIFFPQRTNPGPGFNVPGGEVPIRDDICKHIDYNTHILSQFKKMDLETAWGQRNNNLMFINILETKLNFARDAFSKIPAIPTTEYEFKLKNKILRDLDKLSLDKIRAEARTTLLTSRIQFIEGKINKE
jgi:hypothetical protein